MRMTLAIRSMCARRARETALALEWFGEANGMLNLLKPKRRPRTRRTRGELQLPIVRCTGGRGWGGGSTTHQPVLGAHIDPMIDMMTPNVSRCAMCMW